MTASSQQGLRSLAAILEQNSFQFSSRAALLGDGENPLSHQLLWNQVTETVSALNHCGVGRGGRVAMVLPQGPALASAFLAVAAGATAAPLNPSYLESEFAFYLKNLQARALILPHGSNSPARAAANAVGVPVIELIRLKDGAGRFHLSGISRPLPAQPGFAEPDDVALVLHTSGTTSRPKLVPLTHANLLASAWHIGATLRLQPSDRCLNVMPLFHIHGLAAGVVSMLAAGGSTVCIRAFNAGQFLGSLELWKPTWYSAVPTMHQAILSEAQAQARGGPVPTTLRFIRSSSAALPPPVMAGLEEVFGVPVIESYGMTEAAHQMASNPLPPRLRKPGSVGLAAGPEVVVLGEAGEVLADGRRGEVAIRGPNVIRSYPNNPEASATAFCGGWFRTGDQGYLDGDGYLFITGRFKELINRGGEKIAPREIDEALLTHPGVLQAVAFALPHPSLGEDVAAAVVLKAGVASGEAELRGFAFNRLPAFKVPSRIIIVKEVPKGSTGKVQRIGLAERLASSLVVPFEAPASEMERMIAATICEALSRVTVGRNDNFFSVGGDSLLAAQVAGRLAKLVKVEVPLRRFFETATISALAAELEKRLGAGEAGEALPLLRVPRQGEAPLSFAQQRLWFLDRLLPEKGTYNVPARWRLSGVLDVEALRGSLQRVVDRHEALRTCVGVRKEEAVQVIGPAVAVALPVTDLSALPPGERERQAQQRAEREAQEPFDLEKGPVWRAQLLRLDAEEHVLLINVHHIACDGWSMGVLWRELSIGYEALVSGREFELPALPIQYGDYAVWQREWLQGERLTGQLAYWKEKLAQLSVLELPTDRPRGAVTSYQGGHLALNLPGPVVQGLQELSRREGMTLFMTLVAAFQVLLHRYSGQEDIAVGTPMAGRGRTELEGLIGFFVNTLVLRTDLGGNPTFTEVLGRVRESALGAYTHQDVPFEKLVEELAPSRDLSRNPLFQVMFVLQNAPGATLALPGVEARSLELARRSAKFDLTLGVSEREGSLRASWEYRRDLFEGSTIERMARHYQTLLEGIVADGNARIGQLAVLTAAERQQMVVEWNDTVADYPRDRCIHQLFEEQVARTPEAVAVVFEEQELTYAELNGRANQLARHLQSLGVGPEVLVGICLERSLELIVGLLGILKAGGAYVPLDPKYPRERIGFILRDAGAPVLVTERSVDLGQEVAHRVDLDEGIPPGDGPLEEGAARAANLAYVIYTSGSTGEPKGVAIEHHSSVSFLHWVRATFSAEELSGVLAGTSICFDLSIFEIFGPLSWGGRVLLANSALDLGLADGPKGVVLINTVPSVLAELLQGRGLPASVQTVNLAGEPLRQGLVEAILQQSSVQRVNDLYGPSETTTYSTWTRRKAGGVETVGGPIANTQIYILDPHGQPVPIGVAGELHIGGEGVARGYWHRPELSAEKFVPDLFRGRPGERLFKTGDWARWQADGSVALLGRMDHQVKIRGFRIELGEIESALGAQPGVREAVVLAREDGPGDKRLVAYLAAGAGEKTEASILRGQLARVLPEYMLPSAFLWLDTMPRTPNGKVDRNAMPTSEPSIGHPSGETDSPANLLELELIRIWRRLFNRQTIGRFDNFFELGGHSLLAARLSTEIEKLLGRVLPIAALFQSPTVELLTRRLTEEKWTPPWSSLVPLQPHGEKPPIFLVHGWGGEVYTFLNLVQQLPRDQPAYGLQAVGLDGAAPRHTTVESMAAHYVQEIRSLQPEGPYYLGGYSMGGLIAFEMAQQLHRLGQRVALLALFDTVPICGMSWTVFGRVIASYFTGRCMFHGRRLWGMPNCTRLNYIRSRWAILWYWIARNRSKPPVVTAPPPIATQAPEVPGFGDYYYALASVYRLHRYPGAADVFVSDDIKPFWILSWRYLMRGGVSFHPIPGTHYELLASGHVANLAKTLSAVLGTAHDRERCNCV